MKQLKKLRTLISLLILALPVMLNVGFAESVFAAEGAAQVTLHKKKMTSFPAEDIQNTGQTMPEFDQYQGLAGIEFKVYDVTSDFYHHRAAGKTIDEAKTLVQGMATGTPVAEGVTDSNGDLTLSLNKKSGGKDAVYTIAETAKSGVVAGANMVLAFPVYEILKDGKYGDTELNDIHLYPKNTVTSDGALKVEKKGTAADELLNGAEFAISKVEGNVTKYISGAKDGLYTWSENKNDAYQFITGNTYNPSDGVASSEGSQGVLIIKGLEVGTYVLEETKAPANAELIEGQTKTDFDILAGTTGAVELTVKNDTSKVEKTTPQYNGKDYAIGEEIDFEISVNIPLGIADSDSAGNKYTKFNLVDTHDPVLTFVNDPAKYSLFDGTQEIAQSNYTVTETADGFIVAVSEGYISSLTPTNKLTFKYKMFLNDKADPTQGYTNSAQVDNGHTEDKTPPEVEVTTGGRRFIKIDGDVSKDKPLAGAKFVVRDKDSDTAKYLKVDETTKNISWVDSLAEATELTTSSDGLLDITGLKYGTYYLEETVAPNDYVKLTKRVEFTVDENSYGDTQSLVDPQKVPNKHKGSLPSTGGMGIYFFIGAGMLLLATGIVYFNKRRKEQHA